jgi:hypothetical protein
LEKVDTTINKNDRLTLENQIKSHELEKSLKKMSDNKSPDQDSIITEFYKKYWNIIKDDFIKLVDNIFQSKKLSNSQ